MKFVYAFLFTVGFFIGFFCIDLSGCQKQDASGHYAKLIEDWAEIPLPVGCDPKQIASDASGGTVVLCEDGRVFH